MNVKKTAIAASVSAVLALGLAGTAHASIYAGSRLLINNFTIVTTDATSGNPVLPSTYGFRLTNTVNLNNDAPTATNASCSGTFGGATSCNATAPRLDALPANDPAGTRANNNFNYLGPGANEYSSADNVIQTAELLGDANTEISQIAESELQTGVQGSGNSLITSQTDYTFTFTVTDPGPVDLVLAFEADPSLWAHIDDATAAAAQARASISASFTLQDTVGTTVSWAPQGTAANNCNIDDPTAIGIACTENADSEDLNRTAGTASVPTGNSTYSRLPNAGGGLDVYGFPADQGFTAFGITITGITAGDWTVSLASTTTSDVTRTAAAPEPGTVALLGGGLLAFGARKLRRKAAA
jgi:hypothetical protein